MLITDKDLEILRRKNPNTKKISPGSVESFRKKLLEDLDYNYHIVSTTGSLGELCMLNQVLEERNALKGLKGSPAEGTLGEALWACLGLVPVAGQRLTFDEIPEKEGEE